MDAKIDIKTAGRTLDVFEAFEAIKKPTTLSELAAYIGAPVSSCHGLVRTLRNRGYLYSVGGRSSLYPTKRLLEVATTIAANDPILEQVGPMLAALRDETQETVILGKRQDSEVVYLEVVEGLHTIRYAANPGKLVPLYSSAIGKSILGQMNPTELGRVFDGLELSSITDKTLTSTDALLADVNAGRERGYFVTRGENVTDVMAVARTVRLGSNLIGIAIAGPLHRMSANVDAYAASLTETCRQIEDSVGMPDR